MLRIDRVWQWAWDRYGPRYSWAVFAVAYGITLPLWLFAALVIVTIEESDRYLGAAASAAAVALVIVYLVVLPGGSTWRLVERWAAGDHADRQAALESTYAYARTTSFRAIGAFALGFAMMALATGFITGTSGSRLVQHGIIGATLGISLQLIALHPFVEALMRPPRIAIAHS